MEWFGSRRPPVRSFVPITARFATMAVVLCAALLSTAVADAQAQSVMPSVRTLLGDVAVILRGAEGGSVVRLGLAGPSRSLTLAVRASDARRWADSASRLLTPPPRRRARGAAVQRARAVLEEPGGGSGAMILSRTDSAGTRTFLLFADDAALDAIRQPLTSDEAALLVRLVRRAAPAPAKRPPAKRVPAKRPRGLAGREVVTLERAE